MSKTVKIDDELIELAAREAKLMSRSLAGQVKHWVRIGMSIERSRSFDQSQVAAALSGRLSPDDLSVAEQESFVEGILSAAREGTSEQEQFFIGRRKAGLGAGLRDGKLVDLDSSDA